MATKIEKASRQQRTCNSCLEMHSASRKVSQDGVGFWGRLYDDQRMCWGVMLTYGAHRQAAQKPTEDPARNGKGQGREGEEGEIDDWRSTFLVSVPAYQLVGFGINGHVALCNIQKAIDGQAGWYTAGIDRGGVRDWLRRFFQQQHSIQIKALFASDWIHPLCGLRALEHLDDLDKGLASNLERNDILTESKWDCSSGYLPLRNFTPFPGSVTMLRLPAVLRSPSADHLCRSLQRQHVPSSSVT